MTTNFSEDNNLVGTLNIYYGETYETAWGHWDTIDRTVKDMAKALNAKVASPIRSSSAVAGKINFGRPAGVRFCWKTPRLDVDTDLLIIFDTVWFAATCQCDLKRKDDGTVVAYYPKNKTSKGEKSKVRFKTALAEGGLLDGSVGEAWVKPSLRQAESDN
ncbi:hypothetical protein QFC20_007384 [Naganishia adeliensis]|uniref:Uncharacterized protein n=1 Tax=Naganishia adeliensis TaxID=92952 RepID=A0ACC2V069_9TREE|nr:hypothetical protein QFC20_007384 [Naganishia adeliensis]